MVIGPKELLKLVKKVKLVENLSERELTNPEGAGFDIRIGEVYKLKKGKSVAFLGVEDRRTPDIKLAAKYSDKKKSSYTLKSGEYVLMTTLENVNLPDNICSHIYTRSTLYRCGIQFSAAQIAPGYSGNLTFGLKNLSTIPVRIEMGSRVAHLQFEYVQGGGSKYRGQWQGGRVAATKKEKQV
jgi:deoxycytidine triphosphate deaminase